GPRDAPSGPSDEGETPEPTLDRTDVEPPPPDGPEGVDVEPLSKAISVEHAAGDWTDAEVERARAFVRSTHRKLEPEEDLRELVRKILRAVRRAGPKASNEDILLAWAQGKPTPPRT
ncbi:MAG TPA: hypothetical protein VFJ25_09155, partial [Casimicrobiaceae bacterium]|nr:hypothetical protein [Casimicrobiaceae bacterium]